jgi:hypothetical protein
VSKVANENRKLSLDHSLQPNSRKEDPMTHHHPYSFNGPEPNAPLPRRRPFQLSDERGRAVAADSEAPATAHDSSVETQESRAPLYIAGAASVVILGGLLALGAALAAEPPLSSTVAIETVPRQAALIEKMDAEALDRARIATLGLSATPAPEPSAAREVETQNVETQNVETQSVEPAQLQSQPELTDEATMTPAPALSTPSRIELDEDNPYTTESAPPTEAPKASEPATQSGTDTSDNPY